MRPESPAPTTATRLALRARCGARRIVSVGRLDAGALDGADADRAARLGAAADGLARMIANAAEHGGKRDEAGVDRASAGEIAGLHLRQHAANVDAQRAADRARRRLLLDAAGFPRFDALTVHGWNSRRRSDEASFRRSSPVAERAAAS